MQSKDIRKNWINFFKDKKGHLHLPSASLVPNNPTLLLTNAGMVPFVPYFLGQEKPPSNRAVTVQKCVRVGGKDSDLENIGKTARHLTFFEMLGNFSFGDYFKEEVIPWSWELLTEVYGFKPENLLVSIFAGDEQVSEDTEALNIWHKKVGVPENRILKMGRADNFWGPPGGISGPCGPCSEIYYDPGDGREPIEIWNLVFMQYEKFEDGSLKALPKPNVDTGAGLERMATILQGKETVFETDLMQPLIQKVKSLKHSSEEGRLDLSVKIIADHLRCSSMLIADGVKPSNLGRGYVLRMLIRRAARFAWLIGLKDPFLASLVPTVQEIFAGAYPELDSNVANIQKQLTAEEEAFNKTIDRGLQKFNEILENSSTKNGQGIINGEEAFDLYATYGFPIELTIDLAEEKGLSVDLEAYQKAKDAHSEVSNQGKFAVGFKAERNEELQNLPATEPLYLHSSEIFKASLELSLRINNGRSASFNKEFQNIKKNLTGKVLFVDQNSIVLDRTAFYAEGGGQLSDQGALQLITSNDEITVFEITDVQKIGGVIIHKGELKNLSIKVGDELFCRINNARRRELEAHHTATHLLHAALRKATSNEAEQRGSLVDENRLRFDFACSKKLTEKDLENIENQINEVIKQKCEVKTEILPIKKAIEKGAMAFFGDKYGDEVRVLSIACHAELASGASPEVISIELCGGTHVKNTAEIQGFKIVSESAISAGVRRIEAVAGQAYIDYLRESDKQLDEMKLELKVPREKVAERVKELIESDKQKDKKNAELEKQLVKFKAEALLDEIKDINGIKVLVTETDLTALKDALDYIATKISDEYVLFLASKAGPKISYGAKTSAKAGTTAKDLVAQFASLIGGSGGGRPDFAQGGGGETSKFENALAEIKVEIGLQ